MEVPVKPQRARVFISYSRSESRFADELAAGLEYDGQFDVAIDRRSIAEGEPWKKRLGRLIAEADSVVFVLSPRSAKSQVCAWEVSYAKQLGKRLVPLVAVPLGKVPAPEELGVLNWVHFEAHENGEPRSFMEGLRGLVRALNLNIDWLNEHTRYLMLAQSWDEAARAQNRLLTGTDVARAKAWTNEHPKDAPAVISLQLDFIKASEAAEIVRSSKEREQLAVIAKQSERARRASYIAAALSLLMLGGGYYFYLKQRTLEMTNSTQSFAIAKAEGLLNIKETELLAGAAKLREQTNNADRIMRIVDQGEAGKRALKTTCSEAIQITQALATSKEGAVDAKSRFDELYLGPMLIVEYYQSRKADWAPSPISQAMVNFRTRYEAQTDAALVCDAADTVARECVNFLNALCSEGQNCVTQMEQPEKSCKTPN